MNLKRYLPDTGHLATRTSEDSWGDEAYGTPTTIRCRYAEGAEERRDDTGRVVERMDVLHSDTAIPTDALVWPPGVDQTDLSLGRVPESVKRTPSVRGDQSLYRVVL